TTTSNVAQPPPSGSSATPIDPHDTRAASGPTPLGVSGCDGIASRVAATARYCRRAPEASVNAARLLAACCAGARCGKAASEPAASSTIATCRICVVAYAQGECHAESLLGRLALRHDEGAVQLHKSGSRLTLPVGPTRGSGPP